MSMKTHPYGGWRRDTSSPLQATLRRGPRKAGQLDLDHSLFICDTRASRRQFTVA